MIANFQAIEKGRLVAGSRESCCRTPTKKEEKQYGFLCGGVRIEKNMWADPPGEA